MVVQLLGGYFCQEIDYPTFYHLAVLDCKPCYSQEPWLVDRGQTVSQFTLSLFLFHKNYFKEPNYHEVWIIEAISSALENLDDYIVEI